MKKILIVEDNEKNLYLVSFILQKKGYEVVVARNGIAGVKLAVKENPDLILMDIQLPEIDGLEVTKRIRASGAGDEVPIIALTSYAMAGDKKKALEAGCTGYIEKPIDPETFVEEVEKHL